jgi:hypothetical protein
VALVGHLALIGVGGLLLLLALFLVTDYRRAAQEVEDGQRERIREWRRLSPRALAGAFAVAGAVIVGVGIASF